MQRSRDLSKTVRYFCHWSTVLVLIVASFAVFSTGHFSEVLVAQDRRQSVVIAGPRGSQWNRLLSRAVSSLVTASGSSAQVETPGLDADETAISGRLVRGEIALAELSLSALVELAPLATLVALPYSRPGIEQWRAARDRLTPQLESVLNARGLSLVGWVELGEGRIFSTTSMANPSELRGRRVWMRPGDRMAAQMLGSMGATAVPTSIRNVGTQTASGQINTVMATAAAVGALGWFRSLRFALGSNRTWAVSAVIARQELLSAIPAASRSAARAAVIRDLSAASTALYREDQTFMTALTTRHGVALSASTEAQWQTAHQSAVRGLPRTVPADLVSRFFAR